MLHRHSVRSVTQSGWFSLHLWIKHHQTLYSTCWPADHRSLYAVINKLLIVHTMRRSFQFHLHHGVRQTQTQHREITTVLKRSSCLLWDQLDGAFTVSHRRSCSPEHVHTAGKGVQRPSVCRAQQLCDPISLAAAGLQKDRVNRHCSSISAIDRSHICWLRALIRFVCSSFHFKFYLSLHLWHDYSFCSSLLSCCVNSESNPALTHTGWQTGGGASPGSHSPPAHKQPDVLPWLHVHTNYRAGFNKWKRRSCSRSHSSQQG